MPKSKFLARASLAALSLVSVAALALTASVSSAADTASARALGPNHVPGEKLDSGLGEMQPGWPGGGQLSASRHAPAQADNRVPGEKLDSGLGDLPPYREWTAKHRWGPESSVKQASR